MRTLSIVEFVTLDGVMQSLGSPDEDREGGFDYGGWAAPYGDPILGQRAGSSMQGTTAYLFGRRTYEHMAAHWPYEPDTDPIANHLNSTPKYIVTGTLTELEWAGAEVLAGDPVEAVTGLKAGGEGNITMLGSGVLAQTLFGAGLIDHYHVFVHPLVLGTGKRLFREPAAPLPLRLVDCETTSTGVLLAHYEPA
ncbi:MAG: dihydrofolate reductase family protein [Actinobacteria bacterium]|nr:dihydrofolate reductase family protein [Actinomycetota bacterium]